MSTRHKKPASQVSMLLLMLGANFNTHAQELATVKTGTPLFSSSILSANAFPDASTVTKTAFKYGTFFAAPAYAGYFSYQKAKDFQKQRQQELEQKGNITSSPLRYAAAPFALTALAALYGSYAHGWKGAIGYGALAALLNTPALLYARECMQKEQEYKYIEDQQHTDIWALAPEVAITPSSASVSAYINKLRSIVKDSKDVYEYLIPTDNLPDDLDFALAFKDNIETNFNEVNNPKVTTPKVKLLRYIKSNIDVAITSLARDTL